MGGKTSQDRHAGCAIPTIQTRGSGFSCGAATDGGLLRPPLRGWNVMGRVLTSGWSPMLRIASRRRCAAKEPFATQFIDEFRLCCLALAGPVTGLFRRQEESSLVHKKSPTKQAVGLSENVVGLRMLCERSRRTTYRLSPSSTYSLKGTSLLLPRVVR